MKTNEEICNAKIFKLEQKLDKLDNLNKKIPLLENKMKKFYTDDNFDEPIGNKRKRSKQFL